jgi:heme o synthase
VFTALIGMLLAIPAPETPPLRLLLTASAGIWLLAAAAFTVNCLLEAAVDAKMKRTAWRASASGAVSNRAAIIFALILGGLGAAVLLAWVNALTLWLTLLTFFGYAIFYTLWLKPASPQNIVIGGAAGAMPPVLGWAAAVNDVSSLAWILVLIIFLWTPPHFWALALYRRDDYERAGLPMLPITHGERYTTLHMILYCLLLLAASLMPFAMRECGWIYGLSALLLGAAFTGYCIALHRHYSDALAKRTFKFSITYLMTLFAALLIDHYVG